MDIRLHDVLLWALEDDAPDEAMLACFLRLAYVAGYHDAPLEPTRGQLCRDHGFRIPTKRGRAGPRESS